MPTPVRPYYEAELRKSEEARMRSDMQLEWHHLERAHILGQRWPREHNAVHWRMLVFGFRTKNTREMIGQLPRLILGGVKSFVGTVPIGNTGGANVSPFKPMPVPSDLAAILAGARPARREPCEPPQMDDRD